MAATRRSTSVLVLSLALLVAVGGCSNAENESSASGDRSEESVAANTDAGEMATRTDGATDDSGPSAEGAFEGVPDALLTNVGRDVIYTSTIDLAVEEADAARTAVVGLVEAAGGYVFNQDATFDDEATAVITVKVPPASLDEFVEAVSDLGDVVELTSTADDVTGQVADLDSRITSAARSVERVRGFLDEADDVVQLSTVEAELTRRETELERLVAQREQLGARVDMATVTVTLRPIEVVKAAVADDDIDIPGFSAAFGTAVDVMRTAGLVLLAALGFLLPVLALGAVVVLPVRLVRHRLARS